MSAALFIFKWWAIILGLAVLWLGIGSVVLADWGKRPLTPEQREAARAERIRKMREG